jgi:hypothetical protein
MDLAVDDMYRMEGTRRAVSLILFVYVTPNTYIPEYSRRAAARAVPTTAPVVSGRVSCHLSHE